MRADAVVQFQPSDGYYRPIGHERALGVAGLGLGYELKRLAPLHLPLAVDAPKPSGSDTRLSAN